MIGVLQGRLSPRVRDHYQEFPDDWRREFELANELGLHGMEWLITPDYSSNNPIFHDLGEINQLPVMSVCVDTLVDERITDIEFVFSCLMPLCDLLNNSKINILVIPILDASDLNDDLKRHAFCKIIKQIGERYPSLKFAFEAEMPPKKLSEIVELCDNFYVTYDTGNITSCGVDHEEFIDSFGKKIINVHIKDRTYDRQTVEPMQGDTDFELIFKKLASIDYSGNFILQTARSTDGDEVNTISRHKQIFEDLYEKYFQS
jgi:L-ribulose-5-phosphate 3-epimerase